MPDALRPVRQHRPRQLVAGGRPARDAARRLRRHRVGLRLRHGDGEVLRHRLPRRRADAERGRAGVHGAGAQAPRRSASDRAALERGIGATCAATSGSSRRSGCRAWWRSTAGPATPTTSSSWVRELALDFGADGGRDQRGLRARRRGRRRPGRARSSTRCEQPSDFQLAYRDEDIDRGEDRGGRASRCTAPRDVLPVPRGRAEDRRSSTTDGLASLPICMAKTQLLAVGRPARCSTPRRASRCRCATSAPTPAPAGSCRCAATSCRCRGWARRRPPSASTSSPTATSIGLF